MSAHKHEYLTPERAATILAEMDALFGAPDEQLCSRCAASYPLAGDTLCRDCRLEIDVVYGDLPGADDA